MKFLGDKPLHTLLLLTERPGEWPIWAVVPLPLLAGAGVAWLWASASASPVLGAGLAGLWLLGAVADWALLSALPRRGLSFGRVQPPWMALSLLRSVLLACLAPVAARWPDAGLLAAAGVQAAVWGLLAQGTLVEPFRVQVSTLDVRTPKLGNPGGCVRIVQLSDLHVERLTRRERALPALLADLAPDLIVLTGDYLSTSYNEDPRALADLRNLLAQFHAPAGIYAVWGTPEVDFPELLRPILEQVGIHLLENRAVEVAVRGHRLWLIGLTCTRDRAAGGAAVRELMAQVPVEAFTVLLHHSPDLVEQAAAARAGLMLSGHTHGGQWRLPGFGALVTSSAYWKRFEAGHHQAGGTHLYVSRGLGLEGFGAPRARFFCPPEVVAITLGGGRGPAATAGPRRAAVHPS